ncbi:hypothetical protein SAMN04488033_101284 [Salegentibacter agarivorans]|uniref:Uncharacterized protein n=1 Tax=Salegentibacter agarivorans TaxID=345907 RepID=A0A1I2K4R0_9FLAO|nr:hypothetical protein [Salegentibacter agarivorans]SFF59906.1 hypothetical protein SAMN04488033_101284 [Salegentibacter agarivorans]
MKNFKIYLAYVALLAMLMTSCSKEDNPDSPDGPAGEEMGAIGFTALLQDFNREMLTKQSEENPTPGTENNGLPACPEDSEAEVFVRVQLLEGANGGDVYTKDGQTYFDVPVIPQNDGTWLTGEGANDELELPEGVYRINYFGVYASGGDDSSEDDDTLLYMAPRENDDYGPAEYQNFVNDALPSDPFSVNNGQKKYVDVQVLCYDEHFVNKYGYLFFDFEEVDILYLCLFGNECDEDGRHTPAIFEFEVWNYSGNTLDPKGSPLFVAGNELLPGEDEYGTYEYAEPVCVQLPDDPNEIDIYYGEVWLLDDDGNREKLIRVGEFDENDVWDLDYSVDGNGDSTSNYYHFREGACSNQDDSDPCLFSEPVKYANHFDGASLDGFKGWDGTEYTQETNIVFNALWEEGEYALTNNPNNVHSNWINETHTGNMLVFNGDPEVNQAAYLATTMADVCPDSDYFVSFQMRNVLAVDSGDENDVRLVIRKGDDETGNLVVDGNSDPQVISVDEADGWVNVGLRLKADGSGILSFRLENDQLERNGNDFAIDNMRISNDPSIVSGATIMVVE